MFYIMTKSVKIISCHESLSKGKAQHLVKPSELEPVWFKDYQEPNLSYPNLLYLGRIKNPYYQLFWINGLMSGYIIKTR